MYYGRMGADRDLRQAQAAYVGALHQLASAMTAFDDADVALAPYPSGEIPPWSESDYRVMTAAAQAWADVVKLRQEYDAAGPTA
jgi:hypothetical protein